MRQFVTSAGICIRTPVGEVNALRRILKQDHAITVAHIRQRPASAGGRVEAVPKIG